MFDMKRIATRMRLHAALLLVTAACVSPEEHRRLQSANAALQAQIAQWGEQQRNLTKENERLRADVERLGKQAADADWIREQKQKLDDLMKKYQEATPGGSGVEGVELVSTAEGLAFRVLGGLLFAPGRTEITEQGRQTLQQLIATLQQSGKRVRIDGHTDDQPIQHSQWGTNLRLSVERSLAVADFLQKAGLDANRIAVAGYGEHRPTAVGSSEDSRAKNRRVEILMLETR
jgi:chemotaxis protein MotB